MASATRFDVLIAGGGSAGCVLAAHSWETDRDDRSPLRARIIGGCSAHNACVLLPGRPADYDEWGHGWSHDAIEP